jgi:hypothetical protein
VRGFEPRNRSRRRPRPRKSAAVRIADRFKWRYHGAIDAWRGAAFNRCQTAGLITPRNRGVTQRRDMGMINCVTKRAFSSTITKAPHSPNIILAEKPL